MHMHTSPLEIQKETHRRLLVRCHGYALRNIILKPERQTVVLRHRPKIGERDGA